MLNVNFIYIRLLGELYEDETKQKMPNTQEKKRQNCTYVLKFPECVQRHRAQNQGKQRMKIEEKRTRQENGK
jgi:hypothetical protein